MNLVQNLMSWYFMFSDCKATSASDVDAHRTKNLLILVE